MNLLQLKRTKCGYFLVRHFTVGPSSCILRPTPLAPTSVLVTKRCPPPHGRRRRRSRQDLLHRHQGGERHATLSSRSPRVTSRRVASRRCACAVPPNLPRFPQAWEGNGNRFVAGSRTSLPPPTFVCSFVCVPVDWFLAVLRVAPRRPIVLSYAYFSCDCEILSSRLDFRNFFSPLL